jgi:hypothetical protein
MDAVHFALSSIATTTDSGPTGPVAPGTIGGAPSLRDRQGDRVSPLPPLARQ